MCTVKGKVLSDNSVRVSGIEFWIRYGDHVVNILLGKHCGKRILIMKTIVEDPGSPAESGTGNLPNVRKLITVIRSPC